MVLVILRHKPTFIMFPGKWYQNIIKLFLIFKGFFFHDINGYHSKTAASLLPLFAR